jgi:hypothetical protein
MIKRLLATGMLSLMLSFYAVTAQAATLLPGNPIGADGNPMTEEQCRNALRSIVKDPETGKMVLGAGEPVLTEFWLGCAIKSGRISFWMIPYFINYALDFALSLAGLISILMILVGAYYYISGSLSDDKETGKTIIQYALLGLVIALSSWSVINLLLLALTG